MLRFETTYCKEIYLGEKQVSQKKFNQFYTSKIWIPLSIILFKRKRIIFIQKF